MIRISDISMPLHHTDEALRRAAAKKLRTDAQKLKKLALVKRSVDARKKQDVRFVVTVDVETDGQRRQAAFPRARQPRHKSAEKNLCNTAARYIVAASGRCGFWPGGHVRRLIARTRRPAPDYFRARRLRRRTPSGRKHLLADAKTKPKLQRAVRRGRRRHVFGRQTQYRHER